MKVLLITHNPISTNNNMGKTFFSLFSRFDKSELCQLYVYPTIPNVDVCHSYYRITDRDALKSMCTFRAYGGEVSPSEANKIIKKSHATVKRKNSALNRLGRDVVWKLSHWYSKGLKTWLDLEKPTHIFVAPGYAKFIYDIALKVSKDREIPIVTYICDDYYFVKTPSSFLGKLQLSLLRKKTNVLMKKTECLVTICDEIKDLYSKEFGVEAVTIMTGANMPRLREVDRVPKSISYFGNVGCNRYVSLCEVGRALDKINCEKGTEYTLKVYTDEQDISILKVLSDIQSICLCGFVTGDDFKQAMSNADLLLHTEAFDEKNIDLVKHSVSTKIADSLAVGIPLIAYGPDRVVSMKHLIRNDSALTATSSESLKLVLERALTEEDVRFRIVKNALNTVSKYHDQVKNSTFLRTIFCKIRKENI